MMEMNEAILRKKQPHTTTFVDMLASLGRYSKLVTIAKTAIELRKTYYDSIEGYQREKSVVEKLTKKLVGNDKRAKKYGVNKLQTLTLTLQNGESKMYAKILGTKIYKFLELIDPETTSSSLLQSDRQFLKRFANEEKYHLSHAGSSLATLSERKIPKKKKANMSILGGKKEILNDARRVTQIIPIKDIQTLLIQLMKFTISKRRRTVIRQLLLQLPFTSMKMCVRWSSL